MGARRLPIYPIIDTLRSYDMKDLPHDLVAGLTVSVVDLPQSMAFALIAGVPPVYGIYTAIFLAFLGGLFTSSRFLSVGPTNTQSLLIAATVSRLTADPAVYVQLVVALSLLKGILQLGFAALRVGRFVRFVSAPVMVAFTAGAGVLIFAEQVPHFLGEPARSGPRVLPGVLDVGRHVLAHLDAVQPGAVLLGLTALAILFLSRRISRAIPGPLLAVAVSGGLVASGVVSGVEIVGPLPHGLPGFQVPHLDLHTVEVLLPGALALALLGMLESVAIAKSIAQRTGQRIDADQEFFGQGFANLVGSFFQCMPGSGSFSRTALQYAVGARTRVASLFCAVMNAAFFLALAPLAHDIPLAALAAILFFVAYKLVDWRALRAVARAGRGDLVTAAVTFGAALLLPLTYAIYVGIGLHLLLALDRAGHLHVRQLVPQGDGGFRERTVQAPGDLEAQDVLVLQLEGDLFFGVADELDDHLRAVLAGAGTPSGGAPAAVVLRLKRSHSLDAHALLVLERFIRAMDAAHRPVLFSGLRPKARRRLQRFGLSDRLCDGCLVDSHERPAAGTAQAVSVARALLSGTGDGTPPTPPDAPPAARPTPPRGGAA